MDYQKDYLIATIVKTWLAASERVGYYRKHKAKLLIPKEREQSNACITIVECFTTVMTTNRTLFLDWASREDKKTREAIYKVLKYEQVSK